MKSKAKLARKVHQTGHGCPWYKQQRAFVAKTRPLRMNTDVYS